jgi:hypothetical protein
MDEGNFQSRRSPPRVVDRECAWPRPRLGGTRDIARAGVHVTRRPRHLANAAVASAGATVAARVDGRRHRAGDTRHRGAVSVRLRYPHARA